MIETLRKAILLPVNRAGWPFIGGFALVALLLWTISGFLGALSAIATLWCVWFFRDPASSVRWRRRRRRPISAWPTGR